MEYPCYLEYKATNVLWFSDIPKDWKTIRIKFSTYIKGRVGWHGLNSNKFLSEGDYYLVTGTDFRDRNIEWSKCYRIEKERFDEDPYIHLKDGDLLVTKDGTIGKVAQVEAIPHKATLNSGIFVTRPGAGFEYDTGFMYYILTSDVFKNFVDNQKSGTTIAHLYQNVFEDFEYPCPSSLEEQQKIAAFLDYKTQQIDQLIAKKKALIEKLEEKRIAVITQAVTKGLDKNVTLKPSGVDWLGDVPEHWDVLRAKFVSDIFVPQRNKPTLNDKEGTPWVTMDDMKGDYINDIRLHVSEDEQAAAGSKILKKNSVIASCVGNFGVAAINPMDVIINQQLQAFLPRNINGDFLREVVSSSKTYFELIGTAATLVYVNQLGFENMPVPLPPEKEQLEIVSFLNKEKETYAKMINLANSTIKKLEEYRSALITSAVTGKIDIRNAQISKEVA